MSLFEHKIEMSAIALVWKGWEDFQTSWAQLGLPSLSDTEPVPQSELDAMASAFEMLAAKLRRYNEDHAGWLDAKHVPPAELKAFYDEFHKGIVTA